MTKNEKFFSLMRRWVAINKCLESFSVREQEAIRGLFERRESLDELSKRLGTTKSKAKVFQTRAIAILRDMLLCDDQYPEAKT